MDNPLGLVVGLVAESAIAYAIGKKGGATHFKIKVTFIFNDKKYFRLIHYPQNSYDTKLPDGYIYTTINVENELQLVADIINACYPKCHFEAQDIFEWTQHAAFDNDLWIFIRNEKTGEVFVSGLADFDKDISEGSLEWIQALPEFRGMGLGTRLLTNCLEYYPAKHNLLQ